VFKSQAKEDLLKERPIIDNSDTIAAAFPGGSDAWRKYLEKNLDANVVTTDKAPAGIYTVKLQFIVTETGEIKDISAINVPAACPSCVAEAVKCIAKGPKWEPMTIVGKKVTSQVVQFISFMVAEQ
jgi:protein TonB